jgi:ATP-binding cassette, subfamily B, bacterial
MTIATAENEETNPATPQPIAPPIELPPDLRARLNGQIDGQAVVAWSEFDLSPTGQFAAQYAVLTDTQLHLSPAPGAPWRSIDIASITEAKVVEGLGADKLRLITGETLAAELRYSRRNRRGMTRLHRKLERRMPRKEGEGEAPPDWLEAVERQAETNEICPKCKTQIPSYSEGACPQCLANRKILWRLLDIAKPYRRRIWVSLALTLLMSGVAVLPPIFQKKLIDQALNPTEGGLPRFLPEEVRVQSLVFWGAMTILAIIAVNIVASFRLRILTFLGTSVARDLRHNVYEHMHALSLRFFSKRRTGSLITRVTNDTDRLWDFIVFGSVNLVRDIVMIIVFAAVMFYYNWKLACVALMPVPIVGVLTYYRSMKMQAMFSRLWTYWSRMTAVVGDALPGVRVVKAFSNERREIDRFDRRSDEYTTREQEVNKVWTTLAPLISAMMFTGRTMVWIVGGYLLIKHPSADNTFGTLVMFTSFVMGFYEPIMELANSNRMVTRAASSAQRVFEVLDTPPEIYSSSRSLKTEQMHGRVEFKQVSFSYEGAQPALREVSITVEPGEMIGLCGPSGAGKSTFVNLICRFYDVTDGQLLIDGIDVRDYDVNWLRRQIGVVLQEPYLFHGTIADNIRYGKPDATHAEIIAAARAANAHDFIVGFPDGYDTMVGERGQSLSGGERQRVSIARAILHNPRILILDEATSSVDTETEKQIQQALDRLVQGRTTFAIAHRLSTLQAADRLVVLEKGKIAEQGKHDDLVHKENGVYAKLHKTQIELNSMVAIR